jgi:siroheme synthase-like protein
MDTKGNQLFPIFLRLDKLQLLVVGAGNVGFEKIGFMFRHCTNPNITLVAPHIDERIIQLASDYPNQIQIIKKEFEPSDILGMDLVIAGTSDQLLNRSIWEEAKQQNVLINVADTPALCDFYLSSVVKKGDLKIAISSNGKSPTLTKRLRELLTDVLPEEIDDLIQNLSEIRAQLKGDFNSKVETLNNLTQDFKSNKS